MEKTKIKNQKAGIGPIKKQAEQIKLKCGYKESNRRRWDEKQMWNDSAHYVGTCVTVQV